MSVKTIVESIEKLSVLEVAELVKALEEKFGVSAAAPVAVAAAPAAGAAAAPAEEKDSYDVVLTHAGANKIAVIKAVREIKPELGLKEAKDMTEQLPAEIIKDGKAEEVKEASEKLKAAGATVEVK